MKTLNEQFKSCCETNISKIFYKKNNIFKIKNFFKDPKEARNFLLELPKWDCDDLDGTTKPGMETYLPMWSDRFFMKEIFNLNNIKPLYSDPAIVNMHYYDMPRKANSLRSSNGIFDFPHHDYISKKNSPEMFVLLVNLNFYEIFTNFWKFNGKSLMSNDDYNIFYKNFENTINKNDLDIKNLKLPKELEIYHQEKYQFNEAIIYNASLLHNACVLPEYTKENPRITLRYMFVVKSFNIINYDNKSRQKTYIHSYS